MPWPIRSLSSTHARAALRLQIIAHLPHSLSTRQKHRQRHTLVLSTPPPHIEHTMTTSPVNTPFRPIQPRTNSPPVPGDLAVFSAADDDDFFPDDEAHEMSASARENVSGRSRRRRANHNEIERSRRNAQKQKMEDLRLSIPSLVSEPVAAVHIITRAKEYIDYLKSRVVELEAFTKTLMDIKQLPASSALVSSETGSIFNGTMIQQTLLQGGSPQMSKRKRSKSPLNDIMLTPQPTIEDLSVPRQQRKSSLIFPTGDSNVLFGQRDSLQQLFAGIMPSLLEDSNQFDIKCIKCAGGINNLIMIDCDRCHEWYHIRCVGINTTAIPSSWLCAECRTKK